MLTSHSCIEIVVGNMTQNTPLLWNRARRHCYFLLAGTGLFSNIGYTNGIFLPDTMQHSERTNNDKGRYCQSTTTKNSANRRNKHFSPDYRLAQYYDSSHDKDN